MEKNMDEKIKELNLLLLFLSGWEEDSKDEPGAKIFRSWKGYLFEILNEMQDNELIHQKRDAKSVIILEKGIQKAKELKEKYL